MRMSDDDLRRSSTPTSRRRLPLCPSGERRHDQNFGRDRFISSVAGLYGGPGQTNYSGVKVRPGRPRPLDHPRELGGRGIHGQSSPPVSSRPI